MKKLLLICTILLSMTAFAEEQIGSYTMSYFDGKSCRIEASEPKNGKFDIYIGVNGKHKQDLVFIDIASKDLEQFRNSLIEVRDKFFEWKKIAVENNVSDMTKDFPSVFPKVTIAWHGSQWWFAFHQQIKPTFFVFKDGTCAMVVYTKAKASSNEYIEQEVYWVLQEESEFNTLINILNENVIIEHFKKQENKADLFN